MNKFIISRYDQFKVIKGVLPEIITRVQKTVDTGKNVGELRTVVERIKANNIDVNDGKLMVKIENLYKKIRPVTRVIITDNQEAVEARLKQDDVKVFELSLFVEEAEKLIGYYEEQRQALKELTKLGNLISVMDEAITQYGLEFVFPEEGSTNPQNEEQ
jgi:endo-alpha-1,4-polygalactosaminidase (GH114 family)